jgi:hypothetical protein
MSRLLIPKKPILLKTLGLMLQKVTIFPVKVGWLREIILDAISHALARDSTDFRPAVVKNVKKSVVLNQPTLYCTQEETGGKKITLLH